MTVNLLQILAAMRPTKDQSLSLRTILISFGKWLLVYEEFRLRARIVLKNTDWDVLTLSSFVLLAGVTD